PQTRPLLTVSVPIGLQFGVTAAPIINQSQAKLIGVSNPVGLQVQPDKTLALVGGDITLEGGNLTAASGRIELGSVAANSLVTLNPNNQGWVLGYEKVEDFQNIRLIQRRTDDGSQVPSQVDATNKDGNGGNIQVRGNTLELTGFPIRLRTQTTGTKDGGDLTINTRKLILRDGAAISTTTRGQGNGGKLTVNATDSIEIIGSFFNSSNNSITPSSLLSSTTVAGKAGEININTAKLRLQDGGLIATDSTGTNFQNLGFILGTGAGGNLTVNASKSVELIGTSIYSPNVRSGLFATTKTSGDGGKVTITTGELIVRDQAEISVSSEFLEDAPAPTLGKAGELNITAGSILLDNQGKLTSEAQSGQGGNINLQVQDFLRMR
ncbi:MAG: filamentous hemagglutinin, partial [Gloeotrichia echinulata HAB0833]